jgi:hypothetical protein
MWVFPSGDVQVYLWMPTGTKTEKVEYQCVRKANYAKTCGMTLQ